MEEFEFNEYVTFVFFVREKGNTFSRRETRHIPQKGIKYLRALNSLYKKQLKNIKFNKTVKVPHEIELHKIPFK